MGKSHLPGSPFTLSIWVVIFCIAALNLFSCFKKDKSPFTPPSTETTSVTVTDIDGNRYRTVEIGGQLWMAENLKVTHYRNGDAIPDVEAAKAWSATNIGATCCYDNDSSNVPVYGRLYNWFAVEDSRNIAPAGWHVPAESEWRILVEYLGGESAAGGKMKEAGTTHWNSPNIDATDSSGFSALPAGYRDYYGNYQSLRDNTAFWSSSKMVRAYAWCGGLYYFSSEIHIVYTEGKAGFSIRLVRD